MSRVAKRSLMVAGHRTSVSLEAPFWDALKEIAAQRGRSVAELVAIVDAARADENLSSAIRLFVLAHYREGPVAIPSQKVACESSG
jgi:predicted DNA-binding ribbon-helix-helix protein